MLVIFDNKFVVGEANVEQDACKAYEVAKDCYVIEVEGKQYVGWWNSFYQTKCKLSVEGNVELKCIGVEYFSGYKKFYCCNEELDGIIVNVDTQRFESIHCYKDTRLQVYSPKDIDDCIDYVVVGAKYMIDKRTGEVIDLGRTVLLSIIKKAVATGRVRILKKLCELSREIGFLGRYNLDTWLSNGNADSFDRICKELQRPIVKEQLLSKQGRAVLNLKSAMEMMDQVEGNFEHMNGKCQVTFGNYGVYIDSVKCKFGRHVLYSFGVKAFSGFTCTKNNKEEQEVMDFCRKYSLSRELDKKELEKWAVFLKSIGKENIKRKEEEI